MNKLITVVFSTGLMFVGAQAFSDDMSKEHMSKHEMMKECMSRMTAKSDGSTKKQMHEACEMEMKNGMHKDGMGKDQMSQDDMSKPK
jgi:pentapeptide MXKDX repeat protein